MNHQRVTRASAWSGSRVSSRPWPVEPQPIPWFNRMLDRIAGPHESFAGIEVSPYFGLGVCGITAGFALFVGLGMRSGVPLATLTAISVIAVATLVGLGLLRKWGYGAEFYVLFEDTLAVLAACGLVAWAIGAPVWTVLDLLMLGLGVFLVFGRLGCLACGCCHGRPSSVGIRYPDGVVEDELVGIRLFPVQLVEAAWIAVVTVAAGAVLLAGPPPGRTLWFWLIAYGAGRFVMEFARGDLGRPSVGPLSEAQWLAVLLLFGGITFDKLAAGAGTSIELGVLAAAGGLVLLGYLTRSRWLSLPSATLTAATVPAWLDVSSALEQAARATPPGIEARQPGPSALIGMSIDPTDDGREVHSYSIHPLPESRAPLAGREAFTLAGLLAQRLPSHEILRAGFCEAGVFHFWALVDPSGPRGGATDDHPGLVKMRAQTFARLLRLAPEADRARQRGHDSANAPDEPVDGVAVAGLHDSSRWGYFGRPSSADGS